MTCSLRLCSIGISIWFMTLIHSLQTSEPCFCKLEGRIDDCSCNIDTVDHFNNIKIYPTLKSILITDFFRYIKVNLSRGCPFWPDDGKCVIEDCSVTTCSEEQIPPGLKGHYQENVLNMNKDKQKEKPCDENHGGLGLVNETISDENYEGFEKWQKHDNSVDVFCEIDDESSNQLRYIDLMLNPERYTGYSGDSAHKIWNSIYQENCFKFDEGYGPYSTDKNLNAMCLEKRAFYRAISGLHSSISLHLCADYYTKAKDCYSKGKWGPNVEEFRRRFDPLHTEGQGPLWLRNLYFIYLLELRAIAKAAPYFESEIFYTGNESNDLAVRANIKRFLDSARSFPDQFDERAMFSGKGQDAKKLKEEFRLHFLNISRIMDCVGCDKCRLWGKVQVQGLGTAFKILFSKDVPSHLPSHKKNFRLTRTEVVSLFNAFGRLSNSILNIEKFRQMHNHKKKEEL